MSTGSAPRPNLAMLEGLFSLAGQTAVITGAGAGLGREIASLLAGAGAVVVIADVRAEVGRAAAAELQSDGHAAVAVTADVTDEDSVIELFDHVDRELGGATILVNNAGIYPNRMLVDMTVEDWDRVQSINLRGAFLCCREAVRRLQAATRPGRIVNISSIAAQHPALMGNTHYTASKAGLMMLTKTLALEVAADGILVNAVLPGGIMTETRQTRMDDAETWAGPATQPGRFLLGVAHPSKHAAAVLFLASPAASHITGQGLVVDGGFLIS
jgi:NAD(P)-dependent dehydrogenase (short-subunit alcohol dehydrogenase family)